ncbi:MAG: beta-glucuronidase [Clostridia bacterium]|nr:beta-glucuronidase [Clostridia bacterium]
MLYPVMTESRLLSDLSGLWNFTLEGDKGLEEKWYEGGIPCPETMPVPSSYNDIKDGLKYREHFGWVLYERKFSLPSFVKSQRVVLRCDAVTHQAKVFINGKLVTEHKGGFLPFEAEINEFLSDGENLLTIAVDNKIDYTTLPVGTPSNSDMFGMGGPAEISEKQTKNSPNFDFFNYCGITRPVRIYTTPNNYIDDITVVPCVIFNDDGTTDAELDYKIDVVGEGDVKVELIDKEGKAVATGKGAEGKLYVENVKLWWPLKPYLYEVRVRFGEDVYSMPQGIRSVRIDGTKFLINEKPFYFKGYGKHEDTFPNGRGINLPMNSKDISLMKWQGANSFRTSHYPYSEEMMRLCDEEGIVVIDETPAVGINLLFGGGANFHGKTIGTYDEHGVKTHEHHRDVIRDLIDRDKNHACVVMWSVANEPDCTGEGAYGYFKPLFDLTRELDPQRRPVTMVSVQAQNAPEIDVSRLLSDVICLNRYYGWYIKGGDLESAEKGLREELLGWEKIGKPVMFTEFGADTVMGLHDTTPVMFTEEYQVDYYKVYSKVFDEMSFVMGEQVWNFADFMTTQGIVRVQGNKKGIFTRDRKPKLAAHYYRERWNSIPDFDYKK